MPFPIETQRFFLREMVPSDYPALCKIMQDDTVMYAYEGAFDDRETKAWRNEQFTRYEQLGLIWELVVQLLNTRSIWLSQNARCLKQSALLSAG